MVRYKLEPYADEVLRLHSVGTPWSAIARTFACSMASVNKFFSKRGLRSGNKTGVLKRRVQEVVDMLRGGKRASEIASHIGCSTHSVYQFIRRHRLRSDWLSKNPLQKKRRQVVELAKSGKSAEEVAAIVGHSPGKVRDILRPLRLLRSVKRYKVDDHFFDVINTEIKAYAFGLWASDGYVCVKRNKISLQLTDQEIVERLRQEMKYTGPLYVSQPPDRPTWKPRHGLVISSALLSGSLADKGLCHDKTFSLTFPCDRVVPLQFLAPFMRGYFDGDGCVGCYPVRHYWCWRISITSTHQFLSGMCEMLRNTAGIHTGGIYRLKKDDTHNVRKWSLSCQNDVRKFLDWLYQDATIFLRRKYDRYQEFLNSLS